MRQATQKELEERKLNEIRDELADKYLRSHITRDVWKEDKCFRDGFDAAVKLKDEAWEKRVEGLVTALSIYALTNESFPEYNDLALKALESFRKEVG